MKFLPGQTELRRFPIMGEETWAGVDESILATDFFQTTRRSHHVQTSKQHQSIPQIQP